MFQLLTRSVLAGIFLTQVSRVRPVTAEESKGLTEEEKYLQSAFEQWIPFFARPQTERRIRIELTGAAAVPDAESSTESERPDDSDDEDHVLDEQSAPLDVRMHAAIVSNLECMQAELAKMLIRWRESRPCDRKGEDVDPDRTTGDHRATRADDAVGVARSEDIVCEKTGASPADAEDTGSSPGRSPWPSSSLTELAEAQGIAPVDDLKGVAALWLSDDDPDDVLTHVLAERAARRRVVRGNPDR